MTLFGTSKNGRLSDVDGTISRIVVTFGVNKAWGLQLTYVSIHVVSNAFLLQKKYVPRYGVSKFICEVPAPTDMYFGTMSKRRVM